jgi:peptidoglycan/LPS O-acetylase OafA/YrhL
VLPLLGWLALRLRRPVAVPLALVAGGVLFNLWLAVERPGLPFVKSLPAMLPYFGCGMLAAVFVNRRRIRRRGLFALAGAAFVGADALWHALVDAGGGDTFWPTVVRDLPAGAGFAALMVAVHGARSVPRPLAALSALGLVSYGFYLWHVPVLLWLRAHSLLPLDPIGAALVGGAVSLALAAASWRLIERPAIAWAKRDRDVRTPATAGRQPA